MSEFCSKCGKALTAEDQRCPHCDAEVAVTLPGTETPLDTGEAKGPIPLPKAEAESPSEIERLFDDFDPLDEFAAPSGAGAPRDPTLGGFELTPPSADAPPSGNFEPPPSAGAPPAGDDVLDFIDTGFEESKQEKEEAPELPEFATEFGSVDVEEAIEEVVGEEGAEGEEVDAPADSAWLDYLEPPAAEVPQLPVQVESPSPPVQEALLVEVPTGGGASKKAPASRYLRLLAAGLVVGGVVGVGFLFLPGGSSPRPHHAHEAQPKPAEPEGKADETPAEAVENAAEGGKGGEKEVLAEEGGEKEEGLAEGGEIEVARGAEKERVEAVEQVPTGAGEEEPPPFAEAEALEAEEKWDEALAAYLEASGSGKGPRDEAHLRRSRIYLRQGDLPRALLEARRALSENGERLDVRLYLGTLFERAGGMRDAADIYEAALASHPDDPVLLERLARARLGMGAPWQAIALLEPKVGKDAPASLQIALGEAYLGAGSWARAAKTLAPLGRMPEAAYPLARALLEQGKLREALPHLERAAGIEGVDPLVHRHLGFVYKELRRRRDAARAFRAYLEAEPKALDRREIEDEIATLAR